MRISNNSSQPWIVGWSNSSASASGDGYRLNRRYISERDQSNRTRAQMHERELAPGQSVTLDNISGATTVELIDRSGHTKRYKASDGNINITRSTVS